MKTAWFDRVPRWEHTGIFKCQCWSVVSVPLLGGVPYPVLVFGVAGNVLLLFVRTHLCGVPSRAENRFCE